MLDFLEMRSVPFLALHPGLAIEVSPVPAMRSGPFLAGPVDRAVDLGAPNRVPAVERRLAI